MSNLSQFFTTPKVSKIGDMVRILSNNILTSLVLDDKTYLRSGVLVTPDTYPNAPVGVVGEVWAQRAMPVNASWVSVTYGNGMFVAIAYSGNIAATSPDGITWTRRVLPIVANWYSVTFGNGMFAAMVSHGLRGHYLRLLAGISLHTVMVYL